MRTRSSATYGLSLLLVCLIGIFLFSSTRFLAHAASASITLSSMSGPPTSSVIVNGMGFGAAETVTLNVDATQVGSTPTDSSGAFSTSITIPGSTQPGDHTVQALGQSSTLSAQATFLVQTDWPEEGYDSQHANVNPYENVLTTTNVSGLVLDWRKQISTQRPGISGSPVVSNGIIYVASYSDRVYALDATTGAKRFFFQATTDFHFYTSPTAANGMIYIGSGDGNFYAFNATTGARGVEYNDRHGGYSTAMVSNGVVYVSTGRGRLLAFNAITGAQMWSLKNSFTTVAVNNGAVYASAGNGNVYAFNATTGVSLWQVNLGIYTSSSIVANGVLYVSSSNGNLYALDVTSGATLWSTPIGCAIAAVANGVLYGWSSNNIYAFDAATGTKLWSSSPLGNGYLSLPVLANGVLYVSSSFKYSSSSSSIYALDATSGATLWSYSTGVSYSSLSPPVVVNGMLYVGSADGLYNGVYAFHLPGTTS